MQTPIIYIRLGKDKKGKLKVDASFTESPKPLSKSGSYRGQSTTLSTIQFGLKVQLPDNAFKISDKSIAEIKITNANVKPLVESVNTNIKV